MSALLILSAPVALFGTLMFVAVAVDGVDTLLRIRRIRPIRQVFRPKPDRRLPVAQSDP